MTTFGRTGHPKDVFLAVFNSEDTVLTPIPVAIPELGRSGKELRISYLLRSVEWDQSDSISATLDFRMEDDALVKGDWLVRQAVVYHSFDVEEGRSFWLTIKGNNRLEVGMKDALATIPALQATNLSDPLKRFIASLVTHQQTLQWCDDEWRECINDFEGLVREFGHKVNQRFIPHDSSEVGREIKPSRPKHNKENGGRSRSVLELIRRSTSWLLGGGEMTTEKTPTAESQKPADQTAMPASDPRSAEHVTRETARWLNSFQPADLQRCHYIGQRLSEIRLVLDMDAQVLRDIRDYYLGILQSQEYPEYIWRGGEPHIRDFCRYLQRVEGNLILHHKQVDFLITTLNDYREIVSPQQSYFQRASYCVSAPSLTE